MHKMVALTVNIGGQKRQKTHIVQYPVLPNYHNRMLRECMLHLKISFPDTRVKEANYKENEA